MSTAPEGAVRARPTSSWVVISVDPEARARTAEGDLTALTGRTRDDLVGRRLVDCLHPDDAEQAALLLGGTRPRHHPLRLTNRFVHPDGTEVWAESVLISRSTVDGDDELLLVAMPRATTSTCVPLSQGRQGRQGRAARDRHGDGASLATAEAVVPVEPTG
ncbi:MAG: PAS domain-containing protein [Acidimicrobiales bacterium]